MRTLTRFAPAPATPTSSMRPTTGSPRWHSLDVLKGLALWGVIAHHFQKWAGGEVDGRFIGFDAFVVTDLAAPLFAIGLGAAAVVVGARVTSLGDLRRAGTRWGQILVVGLGIDLVTHGSIEGRGVLPTLAVLGALITAAVAAGVRGPWAWWAAAAGCAVLAVPATALAGEDPLTLLVSGPFALPVYGVFGGAGAAVAAHGLGRGERALPLLRSAAGVVTAGLVAATIAGGVVAPEGVWPPTRYPGHLAFTLWGLVASLLIWAAARRVLTARSRLGRAVARAGQRTLVVFAGHFVVKLGLRAAGLQGELDTWRWGIVTWVAVALVCAATTIPRRSAAQPVISSRDEIDLGPAVPVVRAGGGGPTRTGAAAGVLPGELPPS